MALNLFNWLDEITYHKRPWSSFTDDDKAEFNTFLINRFISMNPDYIDVVNLIQRYPDCPKRKVYQFYCDLLPKKKSFFRYIKASIKNDPETIKSVAEYYKCSTREAKEYINVVDVDNIKKIFNIEQKIKKSKTKKK
jgi:hypothetical protein